VAVVDTRSLSVGAGIIAAAVRRAADDPQGAASIIDFAEALPDRLHTFVLVQDAEPLRRGGRAGLLPEDHVRRGRPLVLSVRGRSVLLEQPKDRSRAVRALIAHARFSAGQAIGAWALGHGDASDWEAVVAEASGPLGSPPAFAVQLDPTVGAHVGPGGVVLAALSGTADL
jgi:fatty acid-binding protein DegV